MSHVDTRRSRNGYQVTVNQRRIVVTVRGQEVPDCILRRGLV